MKAYNRYITAEGIEKIHENTLKILSKVGILFENEKALAIFRAQGARVEDGKVFISEALLKKALDTVPKTFTLEIKPGKKVTVGASDMIYSAVNGNIYIKDGSQIRKSTNADVLKQFKLAVTSPVTDSVYMNYFPNSEGFTDEQIVFSSLAMALKYSDKSHLGVVPYTLNLKKDQVYDVTRKGIRLIKDFDGLTSDYFTIRGVNTLSPLTYDHDVVERLFGYIDENQPVLISSCAMPLLTAPPSVSGLLSVSNAEILAGLVLTQLVNPGNPFIYGNVSGGTDMRTIQLNLNCPESILMIYGTAGIADYYHLPFRTGGSFSDAKDMDAQAGVETTMMLSATFECNPVYVMHGLGSLGTLNIVSLEKFILDEEVISSLRRQQRGIDCSDKKLCFKEILETGPRGSFLNGKTPKIYREEFYMTRLFNKDDPNNWQNSGGKTVKETAKALVEKRLESYNAPKRTKDQLALIKKYIPAVYWASI